MSVRSVSVVFRRERFPVMAGLVPAIHDFVLFATKDVDGRHKAGHPRLRRWR